jgi:hypothetical protein
VNPNESSLEKDEEFGHNDIMKMIATTVVYGGGSTAKGKTPNFHAT